jgi:hypothetical protein
MHAVLLCAVGGGRERARSKPWSKSSERRRSRVARLVMIGCMLICLQLLMLCRGGGVFGERSQKLRTAPKVWLSIATRAQQIESFSFSNPTGDCSFDEPPSWGITTTTSGIPPFVELCCSTYLLAPPSCTCSLASRARSASFGVSAIRI